MKLKNWQRQYVPLRSLRDLQGRANLNMSAELDWGKSDVEVHLKLKGGWGMENLTSACGWIANGVRWRTAKNSTFVIHTGRGFSDNISAVLDGTVDFAFTTPMVGADMALRGGNV
jgi:hypothetical protein